MCACWGLAARVYDDAGRDWPLHLCRGSGQNHRSWSSQGRSASRYVSTSDSSGSGSLRWKLYILLLMRALSLWRPFLKDVLIVNPFSVRVLELKATWWACLRARFTWRVECVSWVNSNSFNRFHCSACRLYIYIFSGERTENLVYLLEWMYRWT